MKNQKFVNHFQKEGYPERTIYNAINRLQHGEPIKEKKRTARQTSFTTSRNESKLGGKLAVSHVTICRQQTFQRII